MPQARLLLAVLIKRVNVKNRFYRHRHSGHVFMTAVFALAVLLVIVLGMLQLSGSIQNLAKHEERARSLRTLSDAGVAFGYWQAIYVNVNLPYTYTRSFGPGSFAVSVTNNSASTINTIKIVSTSTIRGESFAHRRVFSPTYSHKSMPRIPATIALSAQMT